ncbi:MAG: hypothetical protein KBT35_05835 [Firmicutes bacterium]|nr:hypothetical protein [Candidatus Colivicinus equi]
MAYKIIRKDNMAATSNGALIKSAKFFNGSDNAADVENGTIVSIGALLDGEREIHKVKAATTTDTYVGIVCTPEVIYDQTGVGDTDLGNFKNGKDEVITVNVLAVGDIFSIANEGAGADKKYANVTAKFLGTEKTGKLTYNVYEVQ